MPVAAGFLGSDGLRESVVMSGQEYLVRPAGIESASPYQRALLMASRPDPYPSPSPDELAIFTACTGRTVWASTRPWLVVVVAGIRFGKRDRYAKVVAAWEALFGSTLQRAKRW